MEECISVLLIDDEPEFHTLVKACLRNEGFKVLKAMNGPKGIKIAKKKQPDVILLDTMMSEMDGLKVLSELKYNEKTENIPVFMVTGKTLVDDVERAFEIGADGYITKPVELGRLGELIKYKLAKLSRTS